MSVIAVLLVLSVQQLPEPFETEWNRARPTIVERPADARLSVPMGFEVSVFADGLSNPRRMALAPNGDIFVAESRSGEILLLRDGDGDGVAERRETFATALDRPFGMAFLDGFLYVGNNDAVVRFPYAPDSFGRKEYQSTSWTSRSAVTRSITTRRSASASTLAGRGRSASASTSGGWR